MDVQVFDQCWSNDQDSITMDPAMDASKNLKKPTKVNVEIPGGCMPDFSATSGRSRATDNERNKAQSHHNFANEK